MAKTKKRFSSLFAMAIAMMMIISSLPTIVFAEEEEETSGSGFTYVWYDENPYGGTDYFVSESEGDDDNDGLSKDTPWQNLTYVSTITFEPGDRILLRRGDTWHEQQLWPKGDGEDGKPIVIDAYGDGESKPYIAIDGNVEYPRSGNATNQQSHDINKVGLTGAVVLRNQQYWEIHNLEISNDDNFDVDITSGQYVRDGIHISINADLIDTDRDDDDTIMDYFRITNCDIHDIDGPSSWQYIHYGGIVFQVFGKDYFYNYEPGGYYFQDVVIEDNTFYNVELHAIQAAFNWFYDRSGNVNWTDETGKSHEGWEQWWVREYDFFSRDFYIGHNYCESIGQGAIQLANLKDMVCEYNEVNGFLERYNAVSCGLYLWAGEDSVMQYNEVYNGPWDEYDGNAFDLEYTNFNVTYQYNYSHDNAAGWMAYMGNSANSIARYNLSINDNGTLFKNMLSSNYSPTYITNNVFVYDGEILEYFFEAIFKDTVYFQNNVFYNHSTTHTTTWRRADYTDAFRLSVWENNAYYEASGDYSSSLQPDDKYGVYGDPGFVGDPLDYTEGYSIGVENITENGNPFKLKDDSPLIDAGHYTEAAGTADWFGEHLYYGDEIDIGIYEAPIGEKVENPVEKDRNENGGTEKANLSMLEGVSITASDSHSSGGYPASNLIDGNFATRWACADGTNAWGGMMQNGWPIKITIDFGQLVTFDEVLIDEYTDANTNFRINSFSLQYLVDGGDVNDDDENSADWVTFADVTGGMGTEWTWTTADGVLDSLDGITTEGFRLLIHDQFSHVTGDDTPTLTEIQIFGVVGDGSSDEEEVDKDGLLYAIEYAESLTLDPNLNQLVKDTFDLALAEAKRVYEDDDATQDEVDQAQEDLITVIQYLRFLADLDSLQDAIDYAEFVIASGDYEDDQAMQDYKELVDEAKQILDDPFTLQADIDEIIQKLLDAEANLTPVAEPGALIYTRLKYEISRAEAIMEDVNNGLYYADEIPEFIDAYNAAVALVDNATTQDEITAAWQRLQDARTALRLIPDRSLLEELKDLYDKLSALDPAAYTPESYEMLDDALKAAERVLNSENPSEQEIEDAMEYLLFAESQLKPASGGTDPDPRDDLLKELEDLYKALDALNAEDYTADSYKALQGALDTAKAILADPDAYTDEQIQAAIDALNAAFKGLIDAGEEEKKGQKVEEESSTSSTTSTSSTNTGDDNFSMVIFLLVLASAAAVVVVMKKRARD